ncbi:hypothetical protein EVAR_69377_1 [Eumeta japonica]|uniref:Uncharacterized protein n=1 Tax=Eumeta variegata TaxID=151549 RepID=A0A4C1ZRH9_EUMVA|nr:hypothetical protein EVAR_69377_1 [Eumeta japonica]
MPPTSASGLAPPLLAFDAHVLVCVLVYRNDRIGLFKRSVYVKCDVTFRAVRSPPVNYVFYVTVRDFNVRNGIGGK